MGQCSKKRCVYQRAFKSRLTIVDNSDGKDYNKETTRAFRIMKQFAEKKPMNPIAQKAKRLRKKRQTLEYLERRSTC